MQIEKVHIVSIDFDLETARVEVLLRIGVGNGLYISATSKIPDELLFIVNGDLDRTIYIDSLGIILRIPHMRKGNLSCNVYVSISGVDTRPECVANLGIHSKNLLTIWINRDLPLLKN